MSDEGLQQTFCDRPDDGWQGTEVAMVFDGETGNAIDSFDYTAEELQRRADYMAGRPRVTMEPNPWTWLG